eukprot:scaffold441_cov241-Pinguiococcus_pyrenoidosus.AAC.1
MPSAVSAVTLLHLAATVPRQSSFPWLFDGSVARVCRLRSVSRGSVGTVLLACESQRIGAGSRARLP